MRRLLPVVLALAGLVATLAGVPALHAATPGVPDGVRGLWVLRTALRTPDGVRTMVRSAKRAGINVLLVQVRGRGEAYYDSAIDPRAADLAGQPRGFDPLALTLDLAHEAGIQVHAWVNVNLVSSAVTLPRDPGHVLRRHPEWLMVPEPLATSLHDVDPRSPAYVDRLAAWTRERSATVEGLFLSPILPESRAYTLSVLEELVRRYALDGLHLDYIRYPGNTFDYSAAALRAFREDRQPWATDADRARLDASRSPTAWTEFLPATWRTFREDRLNTLVTDAAAMARRLRPGITMSAAVVPDAAEARERKLQDWPGWAASGLLDVVCPMAYTQDAAVFRAQVRDVASLVGPVPMWIGIGAYRLTTAETAANVRVARRAGAAGVLIYSYDSLAEAGRPRGSALTALRPVLLEDAQGQAGR
ncbi:MAG: family 10 glycosylhydrolase [Vicinamibacterales bacterium]